MQVFIDGKEVYLNGDTRTEIIRSILSVVQSNLGIVTDIEFRGGTGNDLEGVYAVEAKTVRLHEVFSSLIPSLATQARELTVACHAASEAANPKGNPDAVMETLDDVREWVVALGSMIELGKDCFDLQQRHDDTVQLAKDVSAATDYDSLKRYLIGLSGAFAAWSEVMDGITGELLTAGK